jgi:aldehyde dehydrogenase (NAD+)
MTVMDGVQVPLKHLSEFFIDGAWVGASSGATFDVIDSDTEELYYTVAEAQKADMDRAVAAARTAFDVGPWPRLTHAQRAEYLHAIANALQERAADIGELFPRQSGVVHGAALGITHLNVEMFHFYGDLADTFPFEERAKPGDGSPFGLLVREPVGVVGAIIPWNIPLLLITAKIAPALLAGCTVVLKASPEAPGEAYLLAEIAEQIGLPAGVLNVVTADREVSEHLVKNHDVDKIAFTGSTIAGRRIASLLGERIGRYTLELGGKSAAVVLNDADIAQTAAILAGSECFLAGQTCSSLTRIIVPRERHDELVEAIAANFALVKVGDPFDPSTQMGPLAMSRARDRVEGLIAGGVADGARLVTGGGRPEHLDRGYYIEPTLFSNVDNSSTIAQEEIFGPVLSVLPAKDEEDAIRIANDSIYGLNASVFTEDVDRARQVAGRLRSGTVGHNSFQTDFTMAFGGFKQSGIGREGGVDGLRPYLETKTVVLSGVPTGYDA